MDYQNRKPPIIYWIPKLHKSISNNRFVIGSDQCTIKLLPKAINGGLKLLYKQTQHFNSKFHDILDVKSF